MPDIREALVAIWVRLNPLEPSPYFLLKFMGTAILLFVIAFLIGQGG
ncbi:MAG: hypothetical protein KDA73_00615 [Rhodobacteraceae bacterium]|nr:hypothetical protein [Paracoccaceae bacterium]